MSTTDPTTAQPATPGDPLVEHVLHHHGEPVADCDWCPLPEAAPAQPATPGLDPDAVERELDLRVRDGASYNPRAFVALQIADRLVAEVRRLRAELDTAPATTGCTCTQAAEAIRTRLTEAWPHLNEDPVFLDQVAHHAAAAVCIAAGPLSTEAQ